MPRPAPSADLPPMERLLAIMARLRTPEDGCPWDLEQTFATVAPYTVEEAYEVADAIERGDLGDLRDELGDLLLQVVFHARMAEEQGAFAFEDVARANLVGLGRPARRVRLVQGDWYDALPAELAGSLDLIVSNPPYVAEHEDLPAVVREWEPKLALVPGPTGLEAYERIVSGARSWLRPGGALVLEIGATQGEAVRALANAAGFAEVEVRRDLAGRDRVIVAR